MIRINHQTDREQKIIEVRNKCKVDRYWFLTRFVKTYDPTSVEKIRSFPEFPYMRETIKIWEDSRIFVDAKSRQLCLTNLMVALHYHLANFYAGEYIIFQSTDEAKAGFGGVGGAKKSYIGDPEALLSRVWFMHNQLPEWLRTRCTMQKHPDMLTFHHILPTGKEIPSTIKAVSSDPFVFNQLTATAVFADEVSKQPNAEACYRSALPILGDKGRWSGISSSEGKNFLYRLVYDLIQ